MIFRKVGKNRSDTDIIVIFIDQGRNGLLFVLKRKGKVPIVMRCSLDFVS